MSIMTKLYKIYNKSPLWLKNSVGIVYNTIPDKYRYGIKFKKTLDYIEQTEFLSEEELIKIQNEKFINLVNYAYNNVPYYKKTFDANNIDIKSIKSLEDINKIPFLTKDIIRENFNEMISTKVDKKKLKYITTGGTSGKPFGFYIDYDNDLVEWAYVTNCWSRIGYKTGSTRLLLRGKAFENLKKGIPWQYDSIKKELSISVFDMTEENMKLYINLINKYKPEYFHGYMSAVYILCRFIQSSGLSINYDIKGILAVSENIHTHQVEFVEKVLKTRVFSFYGHSERLILAGECQHSREYHVTPQYGYAEIIDGKENVITDNSLGELVGTGFNNFGMPLIRYKTGDMARWSSKSKCECGRNYKRIEKVEGRWKQEMLVKKDKSLVSITALNMHSDVFNNVRQFQLYQDKIGKVIIKVVKDLNYTDVDEENIIKEFVKKTGEGIQYSIKYEKKIDTKANGKYIFVNQKLNILGQSG